VIEDEENYFVVEADYSPLVSQVVKGITGKARGERINRYITKIKKGG